MQFLYFIQTVLVQPKGFEPLFFNRFRKAAEPTPPPVACSRQLLQSAGLTKIKEISYADCVGAKAGEGSFTSFAFVQTQSTFRTQAVSGHGAPHGI